MKFPEQVKEQNLISSKKKKKKKANQTVFQRQRIN